MGAVPSSTDQKEPECRNHSVTVHSKRTSGSSRSGCVRLLGCWVGGFVHALAIRGQAVDLLGLDENPRPKEARRRIRYRAEAGRIAEGIPLGT
jgi:hypothetical protein